MINYDDCDYLKTIDNFGPAKDLYHPDYGWILKDGELTPEGKKYFDDQKRLKGIK